MLPAIQPNCGSPSPAAAGLAGIDGFTTADYYRTAIPGGFGQVNSTSYWFAVLFTITSQASSATRYIVSRSTQGSNLGYILRTTGFNDTLNFVHYNTLVGPVLSPNYTLTAGNVNKLQMAFCVFDAAGPDIYFYVNNANLGSSFTQSPPSYSQANGQGLFIGRRSDLAGSPASGVRVHGVIGGTGAPNAATALAYFPLVKTALGILPDSGGVETGLWRMQAADATIPTIVGSLGSLTKVGAPTLGVTPYNWAW